METELAIGKLNPQEQEPYRILAKNKIKQIQAQNKPKQERLKRQKYIINNVNKKLTDHNAMIVKADKGKTTVIINKEEYQQKVQEFIGKNDFQKLKKDPTNKHKTQIQKTMKQCDKIINKQLLKQLTQKDPQPPTLKAQIKLHKDKNTSSTT
jgi:hypothetical protein